jgi:short-subunit dehydrogenase
VIAIVQDLNTLDPAVYTKIATQIEALDLAIVVNNAGTLICSPFHEQSQEEIMNQITVNVVAHTLLTRAVLPKLLSRGKKGLIINMSSIAASIPVGYLAIYSGTKAYIRAFSLALAEELKGKVDVFAACPAIVSTKMTGYPKINSEVTALAVTVQGLLSQAVRETESSCSFKHSWLCYKLSYLSLGQRISVWTTMAKRTYEASRIEGTE